MVRTTFFEAGNLLLGHATISITLETYSHMLPNMQDKTVTAMQARLPK